MQCGHLYFGEHSLDYLQDLKFWSNRKRTMLQDNNIELWPMLLLLKTETSTYLA